MKEQNDALSGTNVRRRHKEKHDNKEICNSGEKSGTSEKAETSRSGVENENSAITETGTFWLTRIILLRYLGFIYFVAFLVALHQNKQLLGINGLVPAHKYLKKVNASTGGLNINTFAHIPSLVWLFDFEHNLDSLFDYCAYSGIALSMVLIIQGGANWIILLSLWILYHSLANIGLVWYGFGWESQLLETGFLAVFLCPVLNLSAVPRQTPTSRLVIFGFRWLIFRIMLGAGLIKIRGDQCWRDLTCMNYHYETQPVPNPMSYYMHQSPEVFHKFETLSNHFVELIVPFFFLLGRRFTMIGGIIQIMFQVVLIISGNLSFLNWLTILPSLACFDDKSLAWMFSNKLGSAKHKVIKILEDQKSNRYKISKGSYIRRGLNFSLAVLISYLSVPVVQNLLSPRQAMNTSFDPLRIVNTYGAFGSVTKTRTEVIFQGTSDDPRSPNAHWLEYEFKCKPGNISRRPCLISPYHYRLDWLMWFAAFQNYQYNPWLVHLGVKLLANDEGTISLIEHNPFEDKDPPRYIRAEHYQYQYTKVGSKAAMKGHWWKRKHIGSYLPVISLNTVEQYMKAQEYEMPRIRKKRKPYRN